jgi:hypothetical protein
MVDRPWFGDLALAALLAIPSAALATTDRAVHDNGTRTGAAPSQSSLIHSPVENRFGLLASN